jgi:hypothetical protein
MSRTKLVLVSAITVISAFALLASTASAKIAFQWKVGGKTLAAGESRTFTTSTDGKTLDFHSALLGAAILLLSNKVTVTGGKIIGGTPGTNEEIVKFENVTVDSPSTKCTAETGGISNPVAGTIETALLSSQIVEGETSHQPLILFSPKTAAAFVTIKFLNKGTEVCPVAGATGEVTGNILAQPLPTLGETLNGDLDFEAPVQSFLLSAGGSAESAGLKFAGTEAATLTGLLLNVLTTDEKYGAF